MARALLPILSLLCLALAVPAGAGPREDLRLLTGARGQLMPVVEAALGAGADIEARDAVGRTALIWAAFHDHAQMLEFLLARGADVNAQDVHGRTALIWAATAGRVAAARALLAAGADVGHRDQDGLGARDWAVREGHAGLAGLFVGILD